MSDTKINLTGVIDFAQINESGPTQDQVLLSIQDLQVWFELRRFGFGHAGFVHAVDGVSFDLHDGEAIAVVGESGCGKSTLMKTILGLYRPTHGKVIFEEQDISEMHGEDLRAYRSKVGYIQQDPYGAMAPFMTIEEVLEEPLLINTHLTRRQRLERIEQVLTEVKLTPIGEILPKFPHMLSGGQQQRVIIARAMMLNPKLIVADEPVSMLDASVRVEILRLLRGLQESHHLAVIYVTHDLSTVRYFSRRIFVMYAGNIVEKARTQDLLDSPGHPYTEALLAGTSDPDANNAKTYKEIPPGEPPSLITPPSGCRFHPRCPYAIKGLCEVEVPPEFKLQSEHLAACWLHREGKT
jgi:peptide/nickel transport system ATP-binding protein